MKGSELKEILRKEGVVFMHLADELGVSQQNLSAVFTREDVKSGTLEKIARVLQKPVGYLYGESVTIQTAEGNNNTQVAGNYSGAPSEILDHLRLKDEQLLLTIKQVSKAQEQMDRVLDRLEGKNTVHITEV